MATGALVLLLAALAAAVAGVAELHRGAAQARAAAARAAPEEADRRAGARLRRADRLLRRTPPGGWLARQLAAADVRVGTVAAALLAAGGLLAVFALADALLGWLLALLAVGLAVAGARALLRHRQQRRREQFAAQLPQLARVLSNATAAGLALRKALALAVDELGDPAATELRRVVDAVELGQPVEQALDDLSRQLPSRELRVLVATLVVQHRAGGALVSALENLAETLEARKDLRREVRTLTAGTVYTSYLVIVIGVGTVLLVNLVDPGATAALTGTLLGRVALGLALTLYVVGFSLIRRIVAIDT